MKFCKALNACDSVGALYKEANIRIVVNAADIVDSLLRAFDVGNAELCLDLLLEFGGLFFGFVFVFELVEYIGYRRFLLACL